MAKTTAIGALKQWTSTQHSKETERMALSTGQAAMSWQTVTRNGD